MNQKKMYALISHYDTYFKQDDCRLLHSVVMEPHIDALLYAPNEAYHPLLEAGHRRRKRLQDERSQECARQAQRIHDVYRRK